MPAILIGGEKGGTGKSTVACNLAVTLKQQGRDVLLIDCDKQATADDFAKRRTAHDLTPQIPSIRMRGGQLQMPITDQASRYQVVIIDCGGQDSIELRSAMITPAVSLMIVPIQASFVDLSTLVGISQRFEEARVYHPNLNVKVILNRAPTNAARIETTSEAVSFVQDELGTLGIFETVLHDRVAYRYSLATGEGVCEYEIRNNRAPKASQEFQALCDEITNDVQLEAIQETTS